MKPSFDEKSPNVSVVVQPQEMQQSTASARDSKKRPWTRVIIGIIGLLVVVAAVLTAVFVGAKLTTTAQKEAWINFKGQDGEPKSEHVVVTEYEEDYTVPNSVRVIYDFDKTRFSVVCGYSKTFCGLLTELQGYAVHKYEQASKDGAGSVCYVSHLNSSNMVSPDTMKQELTDKEVDIPTMSNQGEHHYKSTGQEMDRDLLSPRAKEMCKESKVVWMAETKDVDEKQKRACYLYDVCEYYLIYYLGQYWILEYCYELLLCD